MTEKEEKLETLISMLKTARRLCGTVEPPESWEKGVMQDIRRIAPIPRTEAEDLPAVVFFRFGFAMIALTLLLCTAYVISPVESRIRVDALRQFDPFYVSGSLDEQD